jgi:hypothetical protein
MRPGASADKLQVKAAESLPLVGLARAMADQSTVGTVLRIYTGRGPSFLSKRYSLLAIMQRMNAMQPSPEVAAMSCAEELWAGTEKNSSVYSVLHLRASSRAAFAICCSASAAATALSISTSFSPLAPCASSLLVSKDVLLGIILLGHSYICNAADKAFFLLFTCKGRFVLSSGGVNQPWCQTRSAVWGITRWAQ